MKFHEKLQQLRKEKGLSQESLAEVLGVSRQAVSKWESGSTYPEMEKLITLSDLFGVTLDSIVKDSELEKNTGNNTSEPYWTTRGSFYEYKSTKTLFGLPLVHINIGRGLRKAKGIVAIGNIATGFLSIGMVAGGLLSIGIASLGVISFGVLSVGALLAIGALSLGVISIGAVAVGVFTMGALSAGMFSIGAVAAGTHIAIGDYAVGHIAIGETVEGIKVIQVAETDRMFSTVSRAEVKGLIDSEFPNLWKWIGRLYAGFFHGALR